MGNCCCFERKSTKMVVDWEKLKDNDPEIAQANDMRVAPPKNTNNVKTPLLSDDEKQQLGKNQHKQNYSGDKRKSRPKTSINEVATLCTKYDETQLHAIANELFKKVEIKDRKFHLKVYHQCFIASEMVDEMIGLGYATNEKDACEIANSLHETIHVIKHTTNERKVFKNKKDRFWVFVPSNMRKNISSQSQSQRNDADARITNNNNNIETTTENRDSGLSIANAASMLHKQHTVDEKKEDLNGDGTDNDNKTVSDGGDNLLGNVASIDENAEAEAEDPFDPLAGVDMNTTLVSNASSASHYTVDDRYHDDFQDDNSDLSSISGRQSIVETDELVKFRDIRDDLVKYLVSAKKLKDQKWVLKLYKECATADEVIRALIYELKVAPTSQDAIKIGQKLMDLKLMVHASHGYKVKFSKDKQLILHFINFNTSNIEGLWQRDNFSWQRKITPLLKIKDRMWMTKKHEKCFKGSQWVEALLKTKTAMTILHAREIGTKLIQLGYIQHVTKDQKRLWDNPQMWYRFV